MVRYFYLKFSELTHLTRFYLTSNKYYCLHSSIALTNLNVIINYLWSKRLVSWYTAPNFDALYICSYHTFKKDAINEVQKFVL